MPDSFAEMLVSLKSVPRRGVESWTPAIAEERDGRVTVRRVGKTHVECDVSPSLMRTLLDRGYAVKGARKVWRITTEELGTLAVTLCSAISGASTRGDREREQLLRQICLDCASLSRPNVELWAASFGLEMADVLDLVVTPEALATRAAELPVDTKRSSHVVRLIAEHVPDGDAWLRRNTTREFLAAGVDTRRVA